MRFTYIIKWRIKENQKGNFMNDKKLDNNKKVN